MKKIVGPDTMSDCYLNHYYVSSVEFLIGRTYQNWKGFGDVLAVFCKTLISLIFWKPTKTSAEFTLHKKMKFSIKDFFSKWGQIRGFLRIWSHLPKKYLIEKRVSPLGMT